eukprot:9489862-Pyramimonas_sp.AAC.3
MANAGPIAQQGRNPGTAFAPASARAPRAPLCALVKRVQAEAQPGDLLERVGAEALCRRPVERVVLGPLPGRFRLRAAGGPLPRGVGHAKKAQVLVVRDRGMHGGCETLRAG